MVWRCPPLHLPNWNHLWKWKEEMNANELADWLEYKSALTEYSCVKEAAKQLRQQQEKLTKYELRNEEQRNRIAHLEAKLSEALDAENDRRFE